MKELTEILNQELENFNRFMVLLDEQHKQLIKRDVDGLNKTNCELDLLCNKATDLERGRQALVTVLSKQLKVETPSIKLIDLLERLDTNSAGRLKSLKSAILSAHQQIEEKSSRNRFLIDKSRNLIAESMRIMATRPSPIYGKPQAESLFSGEGNLVNRSA